MQSSDLKELVYFTVESFVLPLSHGGCETEPHTLATIRPEHMLAAISETISLTRKMEAIQNG